MHRLSQRGLSFSKSKQTPVSAGVSILGHLRISVVGRFSLTQTLRQKAEGHVQAISFKPLWFLVR